MKRNVWVKALVYAGLSIPLLFLVSLDASAEKKSLIEEINLKYFGFTEGRIAFTYIKNKQKDIYVLDFGTLTVTPLVTGPGDDELPRWSPDGRKLAFHSDASGNDEIYVIDSDGSNRSRLTENEGRDRSPDWSPDGSKIVFSSSRNPTKPKESHLYFMNIDGSDPQPLMSRKTAGARASIAIKNTFPRWSPRGTEILYSTSVDWPGWDIAVYDFRSKRKKVVTSGSQSFTQGSWHPDGSSFIFSYGAQHIIDVEIWEYRKGASQLKTLISRPGKDQDAVWVDNGRKVLFVGELDIGTKNYQLFIWDRKENKLQQITEADGVIRHPAWTPLPSLDTIKRRIMRKNKKKNVTERK